MSSRCARAAARLACMLFCLTLLTGFLWAQNENETVGFQNNHLFESGHFGENIDVLNGGMNLTVPIGQSYQVTSRLGFGLVLSYSSKVWDANDYQSPDVLDAEEVMPINEGPFGLGFSMHLGRVFVDAQYIPQCDTTLYSSCWTKTWTWVSPDGTPHIIHTEDNERNVPVDPGAPFNRRLTKDLSYARISGPANAYCPTPDRQNCILVETPDGLAYTLERQVIPGTGQGFGSDCFAETVQATTYPDTSTPTQRRESINYCGWYTTLIEDRSLGQAGADGTYPNKIKIVYDGRTGFKHTIAKIEDSSGRVVNLSTCEWSAGANGAIDTNAMLDSKCLPGSTPFAGSTYQAINKHAVATYMVQLPAIGGGSATYRFVYEYWNVRRPHPTVGADHGPVLKLVRLDYPEPIDPPDQYSLYFGYYNTSKLDIRFDHGEVACRTLPIRRISANACSMPGTHARFRYYFDKYAYVAAILNPGKPGKQGFRPGGLPQTGLSRQIFRKDLEMPANTVVGTWKYDRGDPTSETNPSQVTVTDAFGNDTVYFYYSSRYSTDPNNKGVHPEDGAAPDWNDGLNYRTDYYEGTGSVRRLVRSELQDHDSDPWPRDTTGKSRSKENTRVKRNVTQYIDDAGAEAIVSREAWDGQGHWKIQVESGFKVARPRTTRTDFATGRCSVTDSLCSSTSLYSPGPTAPGTSSCPSGESCVSFANSPTPAIYLTDVALVKEISDGVRVLSRTDNDYRRDGRLRLSIDRATVPGTIGSPRAALPLDASRKPGDVMTQYGYSTYSGNALSKIVSTGRTGDPVYTINYTYAPAPTTGTCPAGECGGYLATKTFSGAGFKSIDRDRDANTGLITATRDTSPALQTDYTYDVLGRVTRVSPPAEEPTVIKYVSLLETTVTRGTPGISLLDPNADFVFTRYLYDGLGRLAATQKRPADPSRGFACQKTQYDVSNHPVFKTEWRYTPDDGTSCAALPAPPQENCWTECTSACRAVGVNLTVDQGTEFDFRDPSTGRCDPFGRVRLEITTDADRSSGESNRANWPKVTKVDYRGDNSQVTVNALRGAGGTEIFSSTTGFIKDGLGRLIAVDAPYEQRCSVAKALCATDSDCGASGGVCLPAGGADAYYDYDALDRLEQVNLSDSLTQNQIRRFAYDGLGHLLWADNPESGVTVYKAYDAVGNVLATQDARGNLLKSTYDFAGRLTDMWVRASGASADKQFVHNLYDEQDGGTFYQGKLTTIQSKDESENLLLTERRFYSGVGGRLSSQIHTFADWAAGSRTTTVYSYTPRGELRSIQFPLETPANHSSLTVNYDYRNGSAIRALQDGTATVLGTVAYNPAGSVESVNMPNGRAEITFDSRNRPAAIAGGAWNGTSWTNTNPEYQSGIYDYDGAGNIYQIGSNAYGYDAANRLITARTQYKGTQYRYDEAFTYDIYGNMPQRRRTTTTTSIVEEREDYTFSLPSNNRAMTRQTTFGSSVTENAVLFSYDATGNLLQGGRRFRTGPTDPVQEDVKKFQYGSLNRLLCIQQVGNPLNGTNLSEVDRFQYDAAGNRLWKVENGAGLKTYYVRDAAGQVLAEYRAASTATGSPEWSGDYVSLAGRLLSLRENLRMKPPTGLKAGQIPVGSAWRITLSWDESLEPDRASYKVYRYREGVDTAYSLIGQVTAGQAAPPSLMDPLNHATNAMVRYYVTAIDQTAYESAPSPYIRVMAGGAAPSAPTGLTGSAGDRTVTLTWTASTSSSEILGYEVHRGLAANNLAPITGQLVKGTSFVDLNLTNGTTYYYKVKARDVNETWSPLSSSVSATPVDLTPPVPPKAVTAASTCGSLGAAETVKLVWEANPVVNPYSIAYEVYRNTQPVFEGLVPPLQPVATISVTSYSDPGPLTPGMTYYYALRALHKSGPVVVGASAFSKVVGASPRDATLTPKIQIFAKATDGAVTVQWQPAPGYSGFQASDVLIYRRLNATESCASYVQVASLPYASSGSYTDGVVSNNAAYDYAIAVLYQGRESSFTRPTLAIPLDRPSRLFQCKDTDPSDGSTSSTVVQWKPPSARFYQPLLASTTDGTFGFLKGFHLYHHKRCEMLMQPPYKDNSPLREVVVNSSDQVDRYLIDKTTSEYSHYIDPRFVINNSMELSPTFRSAGSYSATDPVFKDCYTNLGVNCAMPKAVYKVYAEGTWLTVESDWPDHFNPLEPDPFKRCTSLLKTPASLASCRDGSGGNPDFVPSPKNLRAQAAGPGSVRLDWVAPTIGAGKPPIAAYHVYASSSTKRAFKSPLPFAIVGPGQTDLTVTGLAQEGALSQYSFSVATVDQLGHVSGRPYVCEESGVECSPGGMCATKLCSHTKKVCENTATDCSSYGLCSESNAACNGSLPCTPFVCQTSATACSPIYRVQRKPAGNGGAATINVTLNAQPSNGNTLIAVIGTRGLSSGSVTGISQSGADWQKARVGTTLAESVNTRGVTVEIWRAVNVNNAQPGITINLNGSLKASAIVAEYKGLITDSSTIVDRIASQRSSGSGSPSPTTGTTIETSQASEIWIGGMANANTDHYSDTIYPFYEVDESPSTGGAATGLNNTVMEERIVVATGTAGVTTTLDNPRDWAGVIATFKAVPYPCIGPGLCESQTCDPDVCTVEWCEVAEGRWCQHSPTVACTRSTDCPNWGKGKCNVNNADCNMASPICPAGQVCVPGDRCVNALTVSVKPGAETVQPGPPASLKPVLWTLNDSVTSSRGRNGIKLAWVAAQKISLDSTIQGFRVYRSTLREGPYCALLDTGAHIPTLRAGVSECTSDNPNRIVDDDATSRDVSSLQAFYWDQTVAGERVYYYRVSQVENGLETPFAATYQVEGQELGYEKAVLPPPQGFRAWASQSGNMTDLASVVVKWCPNPTTSLDSLDVLPTLNEYRLYRTGKANDFGVPGAYRLLARLSASCLDAGKRCEITDLNACVDSANNPRVDTSGNYTCNTISPPQQSNCNDTTGPRCGILDRTFTCWPETERAPVPYQYKYNYRYFVTAVGTLSGNSQMESRPSCEDQAWLNYCGSIVPESECPATPINCFERRDPDGNGDTLVCGNENARLLVPDERLRSESGRTTDAWTALDQDALAPHRIIGQEEPPPLVPMSPPICTDCNGGAPPPPPSAPTRFLFYHLDHLGSPRLELDAAGTLVAEHHYLPFGDEKPSQIDPSINNKAFTGHQRDGETGLDYMLARYYGSSLGRFQSPDPGNDTDPEDPQSWNMYTYVRNNPVLLIDPDGRKIKYDYKKQDGSKDRKANRAAKTAIKKAAKADPKLKAKYKQLKKSDNVFTVTNRKPGKGNEARPDSSANAQNGIGTGGTFTVDPYDTRDPETGGTRDVSVAMTHEVLAHGTDYDSGTLDQTEDIPGVPRSEIKAVRTENIMRPYTRDPIRTTFGGHPVPDPTADP